MAHIAHRLQAFLSGRLSHAEREQADSHLAACAQCREERDLLAVASTLIAPLPPSDPRAGFAARVALNARARQMGFVRWLRWSLGGMATAAIAALAAAILIPPGPQFRRSEDVRIAQRLDLFEDLAVVQHREALEDLEVVAVLHTLEARP
jgi:anti-sigma factor RsiW